VLSTIASVDRAACPHCADRRVRSVPFSGFRYSGAPLLEAQFGARGYELIEMVESFYLEYRFRTTEGMSL